jgi:hypothetical protein
MRAINALGLSAALVLTGSAWAAGETSPAQAPAINCGEVMKRPMGQQTQAEFDTCSKPVLQKALCDAVEGAARTNGCGRGGAEDPRCMQLTRVLMTCLQDGSALGARPPAGVAR